MINGDSDSGPPGIPQLERLWSRVDVAIRGGKPGPDDEWHLNRMVMNALGIGFEQTMQYLYKTAPTYPEFWNWILETAGPPDPMRVDWANAVAAGREYPAAITQWLKSIESAEPVLLESDLNCWEENGYVVLHDAVTPQNCAAAEQAIWDFIGGTPDDPASWYRTRNNGIMVQFFQHPAFEANRRSERIHKAFAQLWGTPDLWVATDRCGFNVPVREDSPFPGPDLHWDVSLELPIPLGTQGILYLTDTPPEQGAFTLVPGFQHHIAEWLASLPPDANPRQQNLHQLGSKPIGGRAGDLIIWNQALPHGSRPNLGVRPRMVQYIEMYSVGQEVAGRWV